MALDRLRVLLNIILLVLNPLTPTVAIWVYSYKASCVRPRVKPAFVIFDIRASDALPSASECPDVKYYNPVPILSTVGVKGLSNMASVC